MKKLMLLLLCCMLTLSLIGCNPNTSNEAGTETSEIIIDTSQTNIEETLKVKPLASTIDINHLSDCTLHVSLEKGDAYVDDTGQMVMELTVYDYELFDMVDVSMLEEGSILVLHGQEVLVETLETTPMGNIIINGGFEKNGYDLTTQENGVYFVIGASDMKDFYEIGKITLPVSADFLFHDAIDLDSPEVTYYPGDFLLEEDLFYFFFTPHNTTVVIENGYITQMNRIYTP